MRVGIGYDIHAFDPGRPLVLGGVPVDGVWGLKGRADGDVVVQALVDACLGATGLGDIGDHFPESEEQWRDVPSAVLLAETRAKVRARGYVPGNVDLTVVAERPEVAPSRDAMQRRLAELLDLEPGLVNVKATTSSGLGAIGDGRGIACFAVVLLERAEPAS